MTLKYTLFLLMCTVPGFMAMAQNPVIRIDCDMSGRPLAEVLEPGYTHWAPNANPDSVSLSLDGGIRIKLTRKGPYGDELRCTWNKTAVQLPFQSRLVGDGIIVNDARAGAQIEMRISGLPAGRHSILTYHNHVDNPATNTFVPLDIYLNGVQKYDNLVQTVRELVPANVPVAYMYADVAAGEDVVVLYAADTTFTANNKSFLINAIEINTVNPHYLAREPHPENADEHVDADNGLVTLSWTKAPNAVASHVYYGKDSLSVANATVSSALYKGKMADTFFIANNQYSMETYYWRIDEEDADGNITKGNVWYYRPRQLAYSDAEGYGRFARGGRGGKVVHVTNLNDSGPGSLREAVTNDIGPRTIVFDVSGLITLNDRLTINQNNITVAGQTAPGKGICVRGAPFGSGGNDLIIRHVRVRVGGPVTSDGMGIGGNHCIIDNCSISWTMDEAFSSRSGKNITLQRTLISEALNVAGHKNYPPGTAHGYAATISGNIGSFHHNLLAHCAGRNWSLGGGLDGSGNYASKLDIRNNVVYNWDHRTTDGGAHEVNFVNNYYKPGSATHHFYAFTLDHENIGGGTQRCYFDGNVMPGHFDENTQELGRRWRLHNGAVINYETFVDSAFFPSYVQTQSAGEAYKRVLSNVGANQPMIDSHDIRVIHETFTGTYTYVGSTSGLPGLPDTVKDVVGWENYPEETRPANWDSDNDGLPDWWEGLKRLNKNSSPGDFSDANNDADRDGFTQLDAYLEFMGGPHAFARPHKIFSIDLKALTRGYANSPKFTVDKFNGRIITLFVRNGVLYYLPLSEGFGSIKFTVRDSAGSSMTQTVQIVAGNDPALPAPAIRFNGFREDEATVSLDWENDQEKANGTYQLQRSYSEAGPFVTVATVKAKSIDGRRSSAASYERADDNNYSGTSWYRLIYIAPDGTEMLSEVRRVSGTPVAQQVRIWPIPAKGRFNVLLKDVNDPVVVRIYRTDGVQVGSETPIVSGNTKTFNISSPGTYIIKGVNKKTGDVVFVNKMVIE